MKRQMTLITLLVSCLTVVSMATVTTQYAPVVYDGDGASVEFTFGWDINTSSDLIVTVVDADGVPTVQSSGYTVSATNNDFRASPGGTVTFSTAPADGTKVILSRAMGQTQDKTSSNLSRSTNVLWAVDKLTMEIQDLQSQLAMCLRSGVAGYGQDCNLPDGWYDATGYPYWNGTGFVIATPTTTDLSVSSAWEDVIDGSASLANTRTIRDQIGGTLINVKTDYGAIPDDEIDDTNAIQAAYDASGGETVYFPPGTYLISSAIEVDNYGKFKGEAGKSIICQTTASTPLFNNSPAANVEQIIFEGLVFDADEAGCVGWYNPGYYTAYTEFRDCQFMLDLSKSIQTVAGHFRMYNCIDAKAGTLRTSHQAIHFDGTSVKAQFTTFIEGCWFWNSEGVNAAVYSASGNTLAFNSCTWQSCPTSAVRADGVRNVAFKNCNFEDIEPGEYDANDCMVNIKADSTAVPGNVIFDGCWVQNNGASNGNPWTAWAQLTTSGADAKAWFFGCSGNMGNGYWTSTGSGHTLDYPKNTNVVFCNTVASSSSYGSIFSVGRTATFNAGLSVKNGDTTDGSIALYEDSDDGDNYTTFTAQATDANETMYPIYTRVVDVNNAEIKAWATAVELVPAPGSGRLIEVLSVTLALDYSGGALAEPSAPDDLSIEYDDGTGAVIATFDTTGFITATADAIAIIRAANIGDSASTVTSAANVNKNVAILNTGDNYTGAGSTSVIQITVRYMIHDSLGL